MITEAEFIKRCAAAKDAYVKELCELQRLERELAAHCALAGAHFEHINGDLAVIDQDGSTVIRGPRKHVLHALVCGREPISAS